MGHAVLTIGKIQMGPAVLATGMRKFYRYPILLIFSLFIPLSKMLFTGLVNVNSDKLTLLHSDWTKLHKTPVLKG